jgi:hypothetical protein
LPRAATRSAISRARGRTFISGTRPASLSVVRESRRGPDPLPDCLIPRVWPGVSPGRRAGVNSAGERGAIRIISGGDPGLSRGPACDNVWYRHRAPTCASGAG